MWRGGRARGGGETVGAAIAPTIAAGEASEPGETGLEPGGIAGGAVGAGGLAPDVALGEKDVVLVVEGVRALHGQLLPVVLRAVAPLLQVASDLLAEVVGVEHLVGVR